MAHEGLSSWMKNEMFDLRITKAGMGMTPHFTCPDECNRLVALVAAVVLITVTGFQSDRDIHCKYESLCDIEAGKVTSSPTEGVLVLMANQSRKVGANAVINLKI
jgi:hypothetical protein